MANYAFGQILTVQGIVTEKSNTLPLIGATIRTSVDAAITDFEGKFEVKYSDLSPVIKVSYIGYETKLVDILEGEIQNIFLEESTTILATAVITASMVEQDLTESTVSIEVLKPAFLENINSTSLTQGLNLVPGVEIVDGQPNIRGGSGYAYGAGSRVLLLIDNIPALQPDAGFPNWNDIAMENIAQVEIVKGAASALYGSSALNGIINVRYAQPGSDPETNVSTFYTYFGQPKDKRQQWWTAAPYTTGANVLHKQKFGNYDLVAGLQFLKLNSFNRNTYQNRGRLILNNRFRISDRTVAGFNIVGNISQNGSFIFWENAVRGAYQPFNGSELESFNNRWLIDPYLTHYDKFGNKHRVQGRIYHTDNGAANNLDNFSRLFYGEYQFQTLFEPLALTLTTGLAGTTTNVNAGLYGGAKYFSSNAGLYLQLDKKIGSRLSLSGGGRVEYNRLINDGFTVVDGSYEEVVLASDSEEVKPIFRFGVNYKLAKASFLRLSFGQGYRFPTIAEKFTTVGLAGFRIFTNPNLGSETGWSSEIGIKQGIKIGAFYSFIDLAAFWSEYNNMMEFLLTGRGGTFGFQSQNVGDTRIRGFDFSIGGQMGKKTFPVTILAGYTYIDPRYKDFTELIAASSSADYNVLKYRTLHTVKGDIETEAFGFKIGMNARYVSHMLAIDEEFNLFIPGLRNYRAANDKGFTEVNGRISYDYKAYKISFLVNNILNAAYTVRPALLEAPRNFTIRLDGKF